jgi:hypothetical protein
MAAAACECVRDVARHMGLDDLQAHCKSQADLGHSAGLGAESATAGTACSCFVCPTAVQCLSCHVVTNLFAYIHALHIAGCGVLNGQRSATMTRVMHVTQVASPDAGRIPCVPWCILHLQVWRQSARHTISRLLNFAEL